MKDKIRPIYSELQGYLSQAPKKESGLISESQLWEQVNQTIDELNQISEFNYDKFKLQSRSIDWNGRMRNVIDPSDFRLKLNGLINRLYGEFFSEEVAPFSGVPGTNIHMNQQQNQSVQIQMLLEVQSLIDKKISEVKDHDERTFLEKVKSSLSNVKNVTELIHLILSTGSSMGLTVSQILNLFK